MPNTVKRFDETVENYLKYRPSYPKEVYAFLAEHFHLTSDKIVADIGSGTGFLSKLFLDHGHVVYGVEPNQGMRFAAESYLAETHDFHSINGLAEKTTLKNESIDWITVGTAFHWFDVAKTKIEFKRILKSPGYCCLIWNVRDKDKSALLQDYENLILTFSKDYQQTHGKEFNPTIVEDFFDPYKMHTATFINKQKFNWEGLKGRLLSMSHSLRENDPRYQEMLNELKNIFDRYQSNGQVEFLYDTKLYCGQMK